MTLGFTYMGTKRQIAGQLAEVIARAPAGPLLDAFAGMSAVGTAVAPQRAVWCNDVQLFPYSVARSYFTARSEPKLSREVVNECQSLFERNREVLRCSFASALAQERRAYEFAELDQICRISNDLISRSQSAKTVRLRASYHLEQRRTPYCLFTMTYAGGYVGLEQAMEIDSLRSAIDGLERRRMINADTRGWMLIALCRALGRISNSTGHFAQYLTVKEHSKHRFLSKRRKSVWLEWQAALDEMRPLGTKEWRRANRVFQSDAVSLLRRLSNGRERPSVIYCDPPYTKDHYSRYYHLMDTLLLYDYPCITSKGQYRPDRFCSSFSMKTKVNRTFQNLIDAAAQLKATLIMSYPDRGLLANPQEVLVRLLRERFSNVEVAAELVHEHSTLGASNGMESSRVRELVFLARP